MTCLEFGKYIINNIKRATLSNALNICNKIDIDGGYDFNELVKSINDYTGELIATSKIDKIIAYKIIIICKDAVDKYNSSFNYNKKMIIDDFVIRLWETFAKGEK